MYCNLWYLKISVVKQELHWCAAWYQNSNDFVSKHSTENKLSFWSYPVHHHLIQSLQVRCSTRWPPKLQEDTPIKVSTQIRPSNHFLSGNTNWIRFQCREALLAVSEILIWRYHSHVTLLSAHCDYLHWKDSINTSKAQITRSIFIAHRNPWLTPLERTHL